MEWSSLMYDFKYKIHEKRRWNSYEIDISEETTPLITYKIIRNTLLVIFLLLSIFLLGALTFKNYQKYAHKTNPTQQIDTKKSASLSPIQTSQILAQNLIKHLKAEESIDKMNYNELQQIVKDVLNKVHQKEKLK